MEIYSKQHNFHTVRNGELKIGGNVHHPTCVTCHVSHVRCQVSGVRCQVSGVFFFYFFLQSGGAIWFRVCYRWGLPRLVFSQNADFEQPAMHSTVEEAVFSCDPSMMVSCIIHASIVPISYYSSSFGPCPIVIHQPYSLYSIFGNLYIQCVHSIILFSILQIFVQRPGTTLQYVDLEHSFTVWAM